MDDVVNRLLRLVTPFRHSVRPLLDDGTAECLALYWMMVVANDSIDSSSAGELANRLIPGLIAEPWSSWCADAAGFHARYCRMCETMKMGKQVAMAMGAGSAPVQDQKTMFEINVAKSALATAGRDDTDQQNILFVMRQLGELHAVVWPIIRTAGRPRPMSPPSNRDKTGCLLLTVISVALLVVLGGAAIASI
jgi:hypothetical protein